MWSLCGFLHNRSACDGSLSMQSKPQGYNNNFRRRSCTPDQLAVKNIQGRKKSHILQEIDDMLNALIMNAKNTR